MGSVEASPRPGPLPFRSRVARLPGNLGLAPGVDPGDEPLLALPARPRRAASYHTDGAGRIWQVVSMLYAEHEEEWVKARPGAEATCPMCGEPVKAFCGEIQVWHWRHEHTRDCDSWGEPETKWHRAWKETVRPAHREVIIRGAQATHRADIRTADGLVIELQHSSISSERGGATSMCEGVPKPA